VKYRFTILFLLASFSWFNSIGQEILEDIRNYRIGLLNSENTNTNVSKTEQSIEAEVVELEKVFLKIKKKFKKDWTDISNLYMIRGYDLETGFSNGRIWDNTGDESRFERKFELENFKVKNEKIKVKQVDENYLSKAEFPILQDFDTLTKLIENKDTTELYKIQSENSALSGWTYSITIADKRQIGYEIFEFTLSDFWIK
jgi:hypothetical protein